MIGWQHLLDDMVSKGFHVIQDVHCQAAPFEMTGNNRTTHFIVQLLKISLKQCIHLNYTLYDHHKGLFILKECKHVILDIKELMERITKEVPEGSHYLIEVDFM